MRTLLLFSAIAIASALRFQEPLGMQTLKADRACGQYTAKSPCDANTTCTWCLAAAIPSECVSIQQAKQLPPGVFKCDKTSKPEIIPLKADRPCGQYTSKSPCDANATCTWCLAGAIPSECVSIQQSKQLPPGVFKCDKTGVVVEPPKRHKKLIPKPLDVRPCGQYTSETKCMSDSLCVWCNSSAVPSECVVASQADRLPPGVFECAKKPIASPHSVLKTLMNIHKQTLNSFKLLLAIDDMPQHKWDRTIMDFSNNDHGEYIRVKKWVTHLRTSDSWEGVVMQTRTVFGGMTRIVDTCPPNTKVCNYASGKTECCTKGENCIPNVGCRCMKAKHMSEKFVFFFRR